jgi:hypothetical protein
VASVQQKMRLYDCKLNRRQHRCLDPELASIHWMSGDNVQRLPLFELLYISQGQKTANLISAESIARSNG